MKPRCRALLAAQAQTQQSALGPGWGNGGLDASGCTKARGALMNRAGGTTHSRLANDINQNAAKNLR